MYFDIKLTIHEPKYIVSNMEDHKVNKKNNGR